MPHQESQEPTLRGRYIFKDNSGSACDEVMLQLSKANALARTGALNAYGTDTQTAHAIKMFQNILGENIRVFFLPTGTAANTLGCSLVRPEEAIIVTPGSHLLTMERGGPKTLASTEFISLPSKDGKFVLDELEKFNPGTDRKIRMVHITQTTEYGTLYTLDELKRISEYCKEHRLLLGLDGARLPHAAAKLNLSLRELSTDIGVDFLTLGVAKCGGLHGNALILTDPLRTKEKGCIIPDDNGIYHLIKLRGATQSRIWEIAAQFTALFQEELWKPTVTTAMDLATKFADGLRAAGIEPEYPVQTNAVFLRIPEEGHERLLQHWGYYQWHEDKYIARFMFAFDTPEYVMKALLADVIRLKTEGIAFQPPPPGK